MGTIASRVFVGALLFLGVALTPRGQVAPAVAAEPTFQGDAAWGELARRGEKAPLLAALSAARDDARPVQSAPDVVAVDNPAQVLNQMTNLGRPGSYAIGR